MADQSSLPNETSLTKDQLEEFALSLDRYKNSLSELEQIESEMLKVVMNEMQTNSKEEARKHLHNLLASQ